MEPTLISTASVPFSVPRQILPASAPATVPLSRMRATLRKSYRPTDSSVKVLADLIAKVCTAQRAAKAANAPFDGKNALNALVKGKNSKTLVLRLRQLEYASAYPRRRKELREMTKSSGAGGYTKELIAGARTFFPFLSRVVRPGDELSYKSGGQMVQMAQRVASIMPKSPAELVAALQAHKAQLAVLRDQVERAKAGDPALVSQLAQLEAQYKKALQDGAALVTASKLKQASMAGMIKRCRRIQIKNEAERQARLAQVATSIKQMDSGLQSLATQVAKAPSAALRAQLATKLQAGKAARGVAVERYKLLRQGEDLTPIKYVNTATKLKTIDISPLFVQARKNPAEGSGLPTVDPMLRRVMIRYLASKLPRRKGEARCDFVERLRMYAKRTLVRYLANHANGMEQTAAAEDAVVDTLTEDAAALEEAASAGGQPADASMDAVSPLVDEMATDVEQATTDLAPETAANSPASDYVAPSVGEEITASSNEALDPAFVDAQLAASIAEIGAAGNLDVSLSATTEDGETLVFQDAAESTAEDADAGVAGAGAWYKNPFVIGAAALAAVFALRG